MSEPEFVTANLHDHRSDLLSLNVTYLSWVFAEFYAYFGVDCAEIVGMEASDYASSVLEKLCDRTPPEGIFYLVSWQGEFVAMGGLRALSTDTAEVKRIFVHPDARGTKLGELVLGRLLDDAVAFGYTRVRLESAPFMKSAHRIYEAAGFADRAPYPEAEVPEAFHKHWRFMERPLAPR